MIALPTQTLTSDFFLTLMYMFRHVQGKRWLFGPHHLQMARALEDVFYGRTKRLIINIPPRYSKTEMLIGFMAWSLGHYPDSEFLYTSYGADLAVKSTYAVRNILHSREYQKLFPGVCLADDSKAKDYFQTTTGGCVYGTGCEGAITGYGAGKVRSGFGGALIIDDPIKALDFNSKTALQKAWDWYVSTVESRLNNPGKTPIIVIAQRLAEDDLCGHLLAGETGEEWTHLCLPAITTEGKPLYPAKHTLEQLERMRIAAPHHFEAQYQQHPIPLGGGVIHKEWWRWYDIPPELEYYIITADTAQKVKEHNDYSVFQCWGKARGANQAYLLDQTRGKFEAPQLRQVFKAFYFKQRDTVTCSCRGVFVEDKSSGSSLIQQCRREDGIPVQGITRKEDKYSAVLGVTPYIAAGQVFLPKTAPWVNGFVAEATSFRADMLHKHDDQVDPMVYGLNKIFNPNRIGFMVL